MRSHIPPDYLEDPRPFFGGGSALFWRSPAGELVQVQHASYEILPSIEEEMSVAVVLSDIMYPKTATPPEPPQKKRRRQVHVRT
jgi:hypothetical protein